MRVRYFDNRAFDKDVSILENKVHAYNEYISKLNEIKKGASTTEEIQKHLNAKTKFVNPMLSADAMGVKDLYQSIIDLESLWFGMNLNVLEKVSGDVLPARFKISTKYLDELREQHTRYYSPHQEKQIDNLESAVKILNKLEMPYRASLIYNSRENNWVWAKQHTDNNISSKAGW